MNFITKEGLK